MQGVRAERVWGWASPSWVQVLVSLCVVGLGVSGAMVLDRVEEDLPTAYIEPTLAAADLVHISADVIRYRTTVVIGLEAASETDFARLTAPLPAQRTRIESAVDSFAAAMGRYGRGGLSGQDVQALESSLAAYFEAADEAVRLMRRVWVAGSPEEAAELRNHAELHAADNAGPKLMQVSLALDRLMDQVEQQTGEVRRQGVLAIRGARVGLVLGSLALAVLNLGLGGSGGLPLSGGTGVRRRGSARALGQPVPGPGGTCQAARASPSPKKKVLPGQPPADRLGVDRGIAG